MIVNGVTLPDIPAEVLAADPYAIVIRVKSASADQYALVSSTVEFATLAGSLVGYDSMERLIGVLASARVRGATAGATEWSAAEELRAGEAVVPLGTVNSVERTLVWADHDIYEATAVDMENGTYTTGDIWFPFSLEYPDVSNIVTEEYPYITVTYSRGNGHQLFQTVASKYPSFYGYKEIGAVGMGYIVTQGDGCVSYTCSYGDTVWGEVTVTDEHKWGTVGCSNTEVGYVRMDLIWANHDIYKATSFDVLEGTFTLGSELYYDYVEPDVPKPTRVSIGRSLMDGYAEEVQRLTGTTDQMNAVQIREKLSTVKAGIKIGDTVLPPIPEDVLAEYPNAVIYKETTTDNSIRYALCVSATPMLLLPKEIAQQAAGKNIDIMYNTYAYRAFYENEAWGDLTAFNNGYVEYEGQMGVAVGEFNGYLYEFIYTNHDIYEVASVDTSTGQYVLGDIYFSECQNFNGVWLPKIPEDVLAEYPYAVIFYTEMALSSDNIVFGYGIWLSTSRFYHVNKGILSGEFEGYELIGSLTTGKNGAYSKHTSNKWNIGSTVYEAGSCAVLIEGGPPFLKIHNTVWANHDIYEVASANTSTGEYTTDGVYFPPLEDIDSNRVSIGYELFNSIVEEVQRLSGDQEKMDALHAYWKLTTVV